MQCSGLFEEKIWRLTPATISRDFALFLLLPPFTLPFYLSYIRIKNHSGIMFKLNKVIEDIERN